MNNPYMAPAPTAPYGQAGSEPYRTDDRATMSEMTLALLQQTKPWVTFLSVMAFIGSALMFLGGILVMVMGAFVPSPAGASGPLPMSALGAIYIPMALLYVYPALKLWGFSSAIGRLLTSRATADLEAALRQQKSFWKFAGITTIAMMALYAVVVVGAVVVGIGAAATATGR